MAHFYGTLQGARGEATRLGSKNSGMHTKACSYQGAVRVVLDFDEKSGKDIATVSLTRHMGSGVEHTLFEGPVGDKPGDEAMPGLIAAAKGMIHYATTAPASNPGEGYWHDLDAAFAAGAKNAEFEAAKLIRQFLARVGVQSEGIEGRALCPGCSEYASDGTHDPDCKLKEKGEETCTECCQDSDEEYVLDVHEDGTKRCPNCKAES